jgi:hypothetical protein
MKPGVMTNCRVKADAATGEYHIPDVLPGQYVLKRELRRSDRRSAGTRRDTYFSIGAGEQLQIDLLPVGGPVTGTLALPEGVDPATIHLTIRPSEKDERRLSEIRALPWAERPDAEFRLCQTPEGRRIFMTQYCKGKADSGGAFRIEDVPAGPARLLASGGSMKRVKRDIVVPPWPAGSACEPFDLGTIRLERKQEVVATQSAWSTQLLRGVAVGLIVIACVLYLLRRRRARKVSGSTE